MTPSFRPQGWTGKLLKVCRNLDVVSIGSFSKTKREQYDKDMYDEKRRNGELAAAREDGIAEGLAEGRAETVRMMLAAGIPVETIADALGISIEECEGYRSTQNPRCI